MMDLGGIFDWGGDNAGDTVPLTTPNEQGGWLDFLNGGDDDEDGESTGGGASGFWGDMAAGVKRAATRSYVDGLLADALEGDEFAGYNLADYRVTSAGREFTLTDTGKKWLAILAFGAVALWVMSKR